MTQRPAIVIPWQYRGDEDRRRYFTFVNDYYRDLGVAPVYIGTYPYDSSQPLNRSRLRNVGAEHAIRDGATELLFIDADVIIPRAQVVAALEMARTGGPILPFNLFRTSLEDPSAVLSGELDPIDAIDLTLPTYGQKHPLPWDWHAGPTLAVSAKLFTEVGGFDEAYVGWGEEEKDFLVRAVVQASCPLRFIGGGILHLGGSLNEESDSALGRDTEERRLFLANRARFRALVKDLPPQQPNWFVDVEHLFAEHTADLAGRTGVRALQLGAYAGDASVWLLDHVLTGLGSSLTDVDTWEGSQDEDAHTVINWSAIEERYRARTAGRPVTSHKMATRPFLNSYTGDSFDLVYVDASHQAVDVAADARGADRVLKVGGLLVFDDYTWQRPNDPDNIPKTAIDDFLDEHGHRYDVLEKGWQVWLRKRRDYNDVRIAVYAIALDEENNVADWFASAAGADQVLLADTGSSDRTVELANQIPGLDVVELRISPFRFDDARNAALALVADDIDICIPLDLDERLEPGWREALEVAWRGGARRFGFELAYSPELTIRHDKIHARHQHRWIYPVHETLTWTGGSLGRGPASQAAPLWQTDLKAHQLQEQGKASRKGYLRLLKIGLEERPDDPRAMYYLAREHYFYGPWQAAREMFTRYLASPKAVFDQERSEACRLMAKMVYPTHKERWLLRSIWEAPQRREPLVDLAEFHADAGRVEETKHAVARARAIQRGHDNLYFCESKAYDDAYLEALIQRASKTAVLGSNGSSSSTPRVVQRVP